MKKGKHLLTAQLVFSFLCVAAWSALAAQDDPEPPPVASDATVAESGSAEDPAESAPTEALPGTEMSEMPEATGRGEEEPVNPVEDGAFETDTDGGDAGVSETPPAGEAESGSGFKIPWPMVPMGGKKKEAPAVETERPGVGSKLKAMLPGIFGEKTPQEQVELEEEDDESLSKVAELQRLALTNFRKGRIGECIRLINDLITIKPYEAEYHFALGLCYRAESKRKESMKKYQDVLDLGGPKALVAVLKAEIFALKDDKEKVYENLKEAALGGRNVISDVQHLSVLEKFQDDTDFIKLALQLERFEVMRGRRHDPFTNPFPKISTEATSVEDELQDEKGPLTKEQQAKLLQEARKLSERIQFYIKLKDEDKAMGAYMRLKALVDQQKRIDVPKIEKEFRQIVLALPDIEIQISGIRLRYYYNQAQEKLKTLREVFEDGEYPRVEKLYVDLENLAREMISTNKRYRHVADQVMDRARSWMNRARVRIEFNARKPEIQGIIISGDSKMTILNERVVQQGQSLDGIRVVKIESNRVTFWYKGEEIPMVFRRY